MTLLTTASSASGPGDQWNGAGDIFIQAPIYWTSANTLRLNAYNSIYINASIIGGAGSTLWLTTGASGSVAQATPISVTNLVLPLNFNSVTLNNAGNVVSNLWTDDLEHRPERRLQRHQSRVGLVRQQRQPRRGHALRTRALAERRRFADCQRHRRQIDGATSILASGNILFTGGRPMGQTVSVTSSGGSVTLQGLTSAGNVTVRASGNITFNDILFVNDGVSNALVTLRSDNAAVTFASGHISTSSAVEIFYNPYPATGSYAGSVNYSNLTSGHGNGSVTAYMLVNNYDQLQHVYTNRAGTYALGNDIDASASATCNCRGFDPIGTGANAFTGVFDGRGYAILNLRQRQDGSSNGDLGPVGLFYNNSGTIRNLGIIGGTLSGSNSGGGAIATNNYGTISNSFSTATVTGFLGSSRIGGLVGWNYGIINGGSYSTGTVSGYVVGGLVGENRGTINESYAAGVVNGNYAGGLVGQNSGNIRWTYSLSRVTGTVYTGGLVGENQYFDVGSFGSVRDSYVAGPLSGAGIGGLVGNNKFKDNDTMESFNQQHSQSARVWHSYWTRLRPARRERSAAPTTICPAAGPPSRSCTSITFAEAPSPSTAIGISAIRSTSIHDGAIREILPIATVGTTRASMTTGTSSRVKRGRSCAPNTRPTSRTCTSCS